MRFNNNLDLPPPKPHETPGREPMRATTQAVPSPITALQTEFEFELPKGYLDPEGNLHRRGIMRLSMAMGEIVPMRDPRVKSNPAYATVLILSRVILKLGALGEITPQVIEGLFAGDLNYLQVFYRRINGLETPSVGTTSTRKAAPSPEHSAPINL